MKLGLAMWHHQRIRTDEREALSLLLVFRLVVALLTLRCGPAGGAHAAVHEGACPRAAGSAVGPL
eukprot:2020968-Rhodomonas_salina.2